MELSWTTFILEIINFLVLVWILKRFLYKPVMDMVARRRETIEQRLADANARYAVAKQLQEQNETALASLDREKQLARESLGRELEAERNRRIAELHSELEQEKEKARVAEERRIEDDKQRLEISALRQACRFATRLLEEASGADTQSRLVELLLKDLTKLPAERLAELQSNYGRTPEAIIVVSAFPVTDDQCRRLEQVLKNITTPDISVRYEQDSELLAGVRITIGAWVLAANIQDELRGFMELARYE